MKLKQKIFPFEYLLTIWFLIQTLPFYTLSFLPTLLIFTVLISIKYHYEAFRFNYFIFFLSQLLLLCTSNIYIRILSIILPIFLIDLFPFYEHPNPTGAHEVGYKNISTGKDLDIAIFYPTAERDPERDEHFDNTAILSTRNFEGVRLIGGHFFPPLAWIIPKFLVDLAHSFLKKIKMNVTRNARIISKSPGEKFPVIVFSHGLGAYKHLFSIYLKEWASHGYLVFSVDHDEQIFFKWKEYAHFVELRQPQLEVRVSTISKALDIIYDQAKIQELFGPGVVIDREKVFMAGHSFGSATSATMATADERITGGLILLDPWLDPCNEMVITKAFKKPILILRSEQFEKMKQIREKVLRFVRANQSTVVSGYFRKTSHNDMTDFLLTLPKPPKFALRLSKVGDLEYREKKLMLHYKIVQIFLKLASEKRQENNFAEEMKFKVKSFLDSHGQEDEFHFDM